MSLKIEVSMFEKKILVSITIPTVQGDKAVCNAKTRAHVQGEVERALSDAFGGFTTLSGKGGWYATNGEDHTEAVNIVQSWADIDSARDWEGKLVRLAEMVRDTLHQKVVMVSVGDMVAFI